MGAPGLGDSPQLVGCGQLVEPVGELCGLTHAEVADGKHVGPAEVEDQEHVGRPLAEPLDLDQLRRHILVCQLAQALELELAALDVLGEAAQVGDLRAREADAAQVFLARGEQLLW